MSEDKISADKIDESTMLKQIKNKLEEKNIPIKTFIAEWERLEDLEDDLTIVYMNGFYDGEKKWKDKIKEKIEKLFKEADFRTTDNPSGRIHFHKEPCDYQIEILQELLEERN